MDLLQSITTLVPLVSVQIPGPSDALIQQALSNAARKFCDETHAWRETLWPMRFRDGCTDYPLETDEDDVEIVRVVTVEYNSATYAEDRYTIVEDEGDVIFRLATAPSSDDDTALLEITVALRPTLYAVRIPKNIRATYGPSIADGALSELFAMPQRPWTDLSQAALHARLFQQGTALEKIQRFAGTKKPLGPQRFQLPRFV